MLPPRSPLIWTSKDPFSIAMHPPEMPAPYPTPCRTPAGLGGDADMESALPALTLQAVQLRSQHRHALQPIEAALQYHRAGAQDTGAPCDPGISFEQAESHYRAGAQGLRLSEIPQLPQQLRELSRIGQSPARFRNAVLSGNQLMGIRLAGFRGGCSRSRFREHQRSRRIPPLP